MLPHSHVDPGWLKTFEDYYAQSTRNILDNMINKLSQHKNMTFIWTEMSFFSMWWEGAQPNKRRQVRQLVDEGRLEFTSASWVMTDEASPHLYSMLDQMIEGMSHSPLIRRRMQCRIDAVLHSSLQLQICIDFLTIFIDSGVRSFVVEVSIGCDAEIGLVCRSLRARLVAYNLDNILSLCLCV